MVKEPPKMQEMGPKKYKEMVQKQNDFYDKYKAGKKDPKTGEYYHHLSTTDPRKVKNTSGSFLGYKECITETCDEYYRVHRNSAGYICAKCGIFNSISREDKERIQKEFEDYKASKKVESLDE